MYRCSEVVRLISSDQYLTAGILEKLGIRLHLAICKYCRKYARQIRALARVLRKTGDEVPRSVIEGAKTFILHKLSQE